MYKSETNKNAPHMYAQGGFKETQDVYEDLINKQTGKLETKVTDVTPFYEIIQSHKDSQLLDSIIKRYEIDIDKKQIQEIKEDIVDMTMVPQTMTEAYSMIKQIETDFNERPAEIKKAFNNSVGEYVAGIQNGKLKQLVEAHENRNKPVAQPTAPTIPVSQPVSQGVSQTQQTVQTNNIEGVNYNV